MNKKAFTLVELLAVVLILGLLSVIAIITVSNEIKDNKEKIYQMQIDGIINSAKAWGSGNAFNLPDEDGEFIILTLGQLKQDGFSGPVTNPLTKQPFSDAMEIKITKVENNYVYEIIE